jgi:hypothetical protein
MDRHDRELLHKQLRRLQPPPRNDGAIVLMDLGLFLAGLTLGSFLFASKNQPTRTAANDASFAASSPQGFPIFAR